MAESDLWHQFVSKLRLSGADIADIESCSGSVLQNLLMELGFGALQCAKLQTEWQRRLASRNVTSAAATAASGSSSSPTTSQRIPVPEHSAEFIEISAFAADCLQKPSLSVLGIERIASPTLEGAFRDRKNKLTPGSASNPVQKVRMVPMDAVDTLAREGFSSSHVIDAMCPSGLVFYSEIDDVSLHSVTSSTNATACKLVVADLLLGNTKLLTEEEVAKLGAFPAEQVLTSLHEDGFDSIQAQRLHHLQPDAFVVFHSHQAIPRYVVTFSIGSSLGVSSSSSSPHNMMHSKSAGNNASNRHLCTKHGKPYEFWCASEAKLVCSHCMYVEGYASKNCVLIDEGAKQEAPWLQSWVNNADQFTSDVGRIMTSFDTAMDQVEAEGRKEIVRLGAAVREMKEQLDQFLAQAEEEVARSAKEQSLALQKSLSAIVAIQSSVEDLIRPARTAVLTGNSLEVLLARQTAMQDWAVVQVPPHEVTVAQFDAQEAMAALRSFFTVTTKPGDLELPDTIDVNQLKDLEQGQ